MKQLPRFSLPEFLKTLFTSNDLVIRQVTGIYRVADGRLQALIEMLWEDGGGLWREEMRD